MQQPFDEQALLSQIATGDKSACARCIDHYAPRVYRLALRLTQNAADAEDVVQETFLNAFRAIDSFEGRSSIGTWLFRITHNTAMMRLRKPNPHDQPLDAALEAADDGLALPEALFDWCCLPERDYQTDELRTELDAAIDSLSPTLRAAFVLREMEGLSTAECAEALAVSEDVVKKRLQRARMALRERLSAWFEARSAP